MKYPEAIAAALTIALTLLFLGVTQVRTQPATGEGAGQMPIINPVEGEAGAGQQSQEVQGSDQPISTDSGEDASAASSSETMTSGASVTEGTNAPTGTPSTTQGGAGLEADPASGAAVGEAVGEGSNEASGMTASGSSVEESSAATTETTSGATAQ